MTILSTPILERSNENVLRESAVQLGINEPLMTLRTDDDFNQYREEVLASYVSWINSVQQWIDEVSMLSKKVEKIKMETTKND